MTEPEQTTPSPHPRRARRGRRMLEWTIGILVVLIACRVALPYGVEWYVNKKLDESPDYEGHVGDVDIHLYRGAYSIDDVSITKTDGDVPVPLFSAPRVEFSLLWSALFRGSVVASVVFDQPTINIVDSEREENKQTGTGGRWFTLLDELVPLRIDEVQVNQGSLHFRNFDVVQDVDVSITELDATASNLTNSQELSSSMVGHIRADGKVAETGTLELSLDYDPDSEYPTFDFDGRVSDVRLMELDALITAYAPFDIEAGNLSLTSEIAASDGALQGYVKPLVTDLKVFDWHGDVEEDGDNPLRVAWEAVVGFVGELLENQPRDQLATVVELQGRFDDPQTSKWQTFINILRNAFIEALNPDFENNVNLEQLNNPQPRAESAE